MAKKKKLPDDIRRECLSIVAGYERRRAEYYGKRLEIIEGQGKRFVEIGDQMSKDGLWAYLPTSNNAARTAEQKALQLEALERSSETMKMKAVEYAKEFIGCDIEDPSLKKRLADAIVLNCKSGRQYPYKCFDLTGIEQTNFYDRRTDFLVHIAKRLKIL